ncbi:MAG: AAA family ATPase, partial [Candidatus Thorarchaeota archaeon]
MADIRPIINARDLIAVLKALPPNMSALVEGPHGVGKSHIARQVAEHFGFPLIDRRLSQMTEGDMIGLPKVSDDVTRFLPVDWFKRG